MRKSKLQGKFWISRGQIWIFYRLLLAERVGHWRVTADRPGDRLMSKRRRREANRRRLGPTGQAVCPVDDGVGGEAPSRRAAKAALILGRPQSGRIKEGLKKD